MVWVVFGQEGQEGVADQGDVGEEVWVAAAGTILTQEGVAAPVVADFDSAPVAANEFEPVFIAVCVGRATGKVIAALGAGLAGLLEGPLAAQHDQAAGIGEVDRQGFDGEGVQGSFFDPAVAALGLDKKGVLVRASIPRAC